MVFVWLLTLTTGLTATLVTPISFVWHPEYLFCEVSGNHDVLMSVYVTVFIGLPMSLILFCYGSVYLAIRRHNAAVNPSLQEAAGQGTVSAHEIQASRVLLATVTCFFVCWIPALAVSFLERVVHLPMPLFWQSLYGLSPALSSWINPVIYGVMNRLMRKEFLKLLRCQSQKSN